MRKVNPDKIFSSFFSKNIAFLDKNIKKIYLKLIMQLLRWHLILYKFHQSCQWPPGTRWTSGLHMPDWPCQWRPRVSVKKVKKKFKKLFWVSLDVFTGTPEFSLSVSCILTSQETKYDLAGHIISEWPLMVPKNEKNYNFFFQKYIFLIAKV